MNCVVIYSCNWKRLPLVNEVTDTRASSKQRAETTRSALLHAVKVVWQSPRSGLGVYHRPRELHEDRPKWSSHVSRENLPVI